MSGEHVILLHGLCRTSRCMAPMQKALAHAGYRVLNVDYPSRSACIEALARSVIPDALEQCERRNARTIHFVTHSLGGILVRAYFARMTNPLLGRVVMLGPPNQGSEVVDRLRRLRLFHLLNGPAGSELGTDANSAPNNFGPAPFQVGIIAGNRSLNWINSLFIRGPNDGKVSVERTRLAGMTDHITLPVTHPFLMRNATAIQQTIAFLRRGQFDRPPSNKTGLLLRGHAQIL